MQSDLTNNRISRLFEQHGAQHAMFLAGSVAASSCLSSGAPDMIQMAHEGFAYAISHTPFAPAADAAAAYFDGGLSWLGTVGTGLADWVSDAGGVVSQSCSQVVQKMRIYLDGRFSATKALFSGAVSRGAELAAVLRAEVRNALPDDPGAFLESAGKALTIVAEAWGVFAGMKEAYGWASRKLMGRKTQTSDAAAPAQVTNLHINLALGSGEDAGAAVASLASKISSGAISEAAIKSCGRAQQCAKGCGGDLINSDQVVWVSREFSKKLREGVNSTLSEAVPAEQQAALQCSLSRTYRPKQEIEGGIVLSVSPKGELLTHTPRYAKIKHEVLDAGISLN